jgi:hypothetical protein
MNHVEEKLYEIAGQELMSKAVRPGLWTKAFAVAYGDEQKTKAVYVELRVAELRDELVAETARQNETDSERRERENALIRRRFSSIPYLAYEDTDHIPREHFNGHPSQLCNPISALRVAEVTGLLHFEVADIIKRGYVKGIYDGDDWYCELGANA